MQVPPQFTCMPGHETVQEPPLHTCPATQATPALAPAQSPEAPQLPRLVAGFDTAAAAVDLRSRARNGAGTRRADLTGGAGRAGAAPGAPQPAVAPQLVRLVIGLTQLPPQLIWPAGHETWQVPLPHTLPAAQALPQAPQLNRSICVLTQEGAPASPPPQVTRPLPQVSRHCPAEQTWPLAHLRSQSPQLLDPTACPCRPGRRRWSRRCS